jgi:hypothetical protein
MKMIITSPFSTATPDSAMNPTAAEIENGDVAQPQRDHASGETERDRREDEQRVLEAELKVAKSSSRISRKQTGTTIVRRSFAATRFSNCPPHASHCRRAVRARRSFASASSTNVAEVASTHVALDDNASLCRSRG